MEKKELRRSGTDCKLCGVCGGLGEYFGIDSNLIRLLWIAFTIFGGSGVILYILAVVIMPKAETSYTEESTTEEFKTENTTDYKTEDTFEE